VAWCRLDQVRAAIPPDQEPAPEPLLRVPAHVWKRLITEPGRQRLEELPAADEAAVYRWTWGRFRERTQRGEFAA
jgi:hypothetical protein